MTTERPNALIWLFATAAVLALDQATKQWALTSLPEYSAIPVFKGWWNWYRTSNPGAAFSLLIDAGGWQRPALTLFAIGVAIMLALWLRRTPRRAWSLALPIALIISGALGNALDRLVHGEVVDFIQWYWRGWYWPAFNFADAAIVVGAVSLMLHSWRRVSEHDAGH